MKKYILYMAKFASIMLVFPLAVMCNVVKSDHFFMSCGQFISLVPGKFGSLLRITFYKYTTIFCSEKGYIGFGSFLSHKNTKLEDGFYVGSYCIIGMSIIKKHCTIGSHVSILSGKRQHRFDQIGVPIQEQVGSYEQVRLGENCWIGERSLIMADLGTQCIVGAGSVVTKSFDDLSIVGGNPAKLLGQVGER